MSQVTKDDGPQGRGFTLVELLTAVGIIAILAGLLLPVIGYIRREAVKAKCRNNLHAIGLGIHQYTHFWGGYYPYYGGWRTSWDPSLYFTWRDVITPFMTSIDMRAIDGPKEYDFTFHRGNGLPDLFRDPSPGTGSGRYFGSSRVFWRRWYDYGGLDIAGHLHHSQVAFPSLTPVVAPASKRLLGDNGGPSYVYNTFIYSIGFSYNGLIVQQNKQHLEAIDFRHGSVANVLFLDLHVEPFDEYRGPDRRRLASLWNTYRLRNMPSM